MTMKRIGRHRGIRQAPALKQTATASWKLKPRQTDLQGPHFLGRLASRLESLTSQKQSAAPKDRAQLLLTLATTFTTKEGFPPQEDPP